MAGQSLRLLDAQALSASKETPLEQVADLGAYRQLVIHCRILKAGSAGSITIQDAATKESAAFRSTAATWNLSSTSNSGVTELTVFLRYVRWITDGSVADSPVAIIDIVAKE